MSSRFRSIIADSLRLLTLSTFQKVVGSVTGALYFALLPPAAYAGWKSLSAFFQIGIPGWTFYQAELAKRRAARDPLWAAMWRVLLVGSVCFGLAAVTLTKIFSESILRLYPTAAPYAHLLTIGAWLFLLTPVKNCFALWWQVTGRYKHYAWIQGLENLLTLALLCTGFFVWRLGVVAIPTGLVLSQVVMLGITVWQRRKTLNGEPVLEHVPFRRAVRAVYAVFRGEGKWVVVREWWWDLYEAGKAAVLNALMPASTLGYVFAGETLATYSASFVSSVQPVLNTALPEMHGLKQDAGQAYVRARRFMVFVSWVAYASLLPVIFILTSFVFTRYAAAFPYYVLFSLQLPWSAAAAAVMPYIFTMNVQRRMFYLTLERNVIEMGIILAAYVFGLPVAWGVAVAHLAAGYDNIFRRLAIVRAKVPEEGGLWRTLLPSADSWPDVRRVAVELLRLGRGLLRRD